MPDQRPPSPFERDLAERIRTEPGFKKELAEARAALLARNWKIPGALWLPVRCAHNGG